MKWTMKDYVRQTPSVCFENIKNYKLLTKPLLDVVKDKHLSKVILVASGSSNNACYCAKPFLEKVLQIEVKIITPFVYTMYESEIKDDELLIFITQSGLSTNTIDAVKKANDLRYQTICLTANTHADIKEFADIVIDYGVGEELVGYVTKGVTTLILFLMLFAVAYTNDEVYLNDIKKAIQHNEDMIEKTLQFIEKHYKKFTSMQNCYVCASGSNVGTAMESALKIGETIHVPSFHYEIEEYIHGPNLQLTPSYSILFYDNQDQASDRLYTIYKATREVSDSCYMISSNSEYTNDEHSLVIENDVCSEVKVLIYIVFPQLLSGVISKDTNSNLQHPLMKKFKQIVSSKTENFVNYDED